MAGLTGASLPGKERTARWWGPPTERWEEPRASSSVQVTDRRTCRLKKLFASCQSVFSWGSPGVLCVVSVRSDPPLLPGPGRCGPGSGG